MKLIPNWRRAWRMASVQFAAVAVAWGSLPTETQTSILSAIGMPAERVPAVLGLLILAGRLIDQPKAH